MNKEELPALPADMHWEPFVGCWTVVDDLHGGAVTIGFKNRSFESGWSLPYTKKGDFSGRGWKEKLVAAAVAVLREHQT